LALGWWGVSSQRRPTSFRPSVSAAFSIAVEVFEILRPTARLLQALPSGLVDNDHRLTRAAIRRGSPRRS